MQPHLIQLVHTTSTMDVARDLFTKGEISIPTLITAQTQEAGRGRHGRQWISPEGNLLLSIVTHDVNPQDLSQYALMWGVVLRHTIAKFLKPGNKVQSKWPNDVLVNEKKVGGLLIERCETEDKQALIVGVGVNILHAPEGVRFPAATLKDELLQDLTPLELATEIFNHYQDRRQVWQNQGFDPIRADWMANAWSLNKEVKVRQGEKDVIGVMQGINDKGALEVLDHEGSLQTLYTGDVFLGGT